MKCVIKDEHLEVQVATLPADIATVVSGELFQKESYIRKTMGSVAQPTMALLTVALLTIPTADQSGGGGGVCKGDGKRGRGRVEAKHG